MAIRRTFVSTAERLAYEVTSFDVGETFATLDTDETYTAIRRGSGEGSWETNNNAVADFGYITPDSFGDVGGSGVDSSIAINAAIVYASGLPLKPRIVLGPLNYYINSPIRFYDGIVVEGPGGAAAGLQYGANLLWNGSAGASMINMWGREMALRNVSLRCASGKTCDRAIDITKDVNGGVCTANDLVNVYVRGTGTMTYGIVYGDTTGGTVGYPSNCDYMRLDRVYVHGPSTAAIYVPNDSGQAKNYMLTLCSLGVSQYGIKCNRLGFRAYSTGFTACTVAAVSNTAPCDTKEFYGGDAESCARLYEEDGATGAAQPILISGGRYDASTGLNADGRYIKTGTPGPLTVQGTYFAGASPTNFSIHVTLGARMAKINTIGVRFPRVTGGINSCVTGNNRDWSRIGCNIQDSGGDSIPVPDQINASSASTTTTDATLTEGAVYRVSGAAGVAGTMQFRAFVTALQAATGDSAAYVVDAVVYIDAAGVCTLKSTAVTVLYEDQAAWAAVVSLTSSVLLRTQVTGEAAKTITWNSTIQLVQASN